MPQTSPTLMLRTYDHSDTITKELSIRIRRFIRTVRAVRARLKTLDAYS